MPLRTLDVFLGVLGVVIIRRAYKAATTPARLSLPPGPKGLPIIGNMFDMPLRDHWQIFAKWAEKWGDVTSLTILGQTFIFINTAKAASDLMDKRSIIYSDRPAITMGGVLVGWEHTFILAQYGSAAHREGRKHSTRLMGSPAAMKIYFPAQEVEARKFLRRMLEQPDTLPQQVRKFSGALILRIIYGYEIQENDDPLVELAEEVMEQFVQSTAPGAWIVDVLPILRFVPSWFPGVKFKKLAAHWAHQLNRMREEPYAYVKEQMAAGTAQPSFVGDLLGNDTTPEEENAIKWTALSLTAGGSDTSVGQSIAFFLAMILHPEVMHKAQTEIDALTNGERLPAFADKDQLPYLNALVTELFRWHTLVPLGVVHRSTDDDSYLGHYIPKGSIILPNIWQMSHDPNVFDSPFIFKPERFLGANPESSDNIWFGFGRRICPGEHFAGSSVWITCAVSLAVFDITKALDKDGIPITPVHENLQGGISYPKPFPYSIKPRSERAAALILAAAEEQL